MHETNKKSLDNMITKMVDTISSKIVPRMGWGMSRRSWRPRQTFGCLAGPSLPANRVTLGKHRIAINNDSSRLMISNHHPHSPSPLPHPPRPTKPPSKSLQRKRSSPGRCVPLSLIEVMWAGSGRRWEGDEGQGHEGRPCERETHPPRRREAAAARRLPLGYGDCPEMEAAAARRLLLLGYDDDQQQHDRCCSDTATDMFSSSTTAAAARIGDVDATTGTAAARRPPLGYNDDGVGSSSSTPLLLLVYDAGEEVATAAAARPLLPLVYGHDYNDEEGGATAARWPLPLVCEYGDEEAGVAAVRPLLLLLYGYGNRRRARWLPLGYDNDGKVGAAARQLLLLHYDGDNEVGAAVAAIR
ncbi:hypothetical protein BDZ97DRAFT_1764651 [Flammula alnicola]|nr:hypothetical protein BDZ97DRAFT_1764651 [Flammula alnicola]